MIKDFIKAFKEAYCNIYKERLEAKEKIKEVKHLIKNYNEVLGKSQRIENLLGDIWHFLPCNQRRNYVQNTLDLLIYGFDVPMSSEGGMIGNYKRIITKATYYLNSMKESYKKHNYKMVNEYYDKLNNTINKYLKDWGI